MAISIANVELSYSFDHWRITTNEVIEALKNQVVLKDDPNIIQTVGVLDSIQVPATRVQSSPSSVLQLANVAYISYFSVGQHLRIYGAHTWTPSYIPLDPPVSPIVSSDTLTTGSTIFSYKICQFEYESGKISPASEAASISTVNTDAFSTTNYVNVRINPRRTDCGILVYRKIGIGAEPYSLVSVLGPKELSGSDATWKDYYKYEYVDWARKNSTFNHFSANSGVIHFPVTVPTGNTRGWVNASVSFVDTTLGRITLDSDYDFEANCIISHDDTAEVQAAIDGRVANNFNTATLADKSYIISGLKIPDGFGLYGVGSKTRLTKLSWSSNSNTGNRLVTANTTAYLESGASISNIILDGNMQNQYLNADDSLEGTNYLVNLVGNSIIFQNLKIINPIGGGIYTSNSSEVTITTSSITDGCLTDRYDYSPFKADNGKNTVVNSNIFRNFPGSIDCSLTQVGSAVGNIMENCGSGLFIYGSRYFVSSPNVLVGSAGEFIPSPDILNSEYDAVNIILEPGTTYNSSVLVYQENGVNFDLTENRANTSFRVDKLRKVDNVEELYGEIIIGNSSPIALNPTTLEEYANGQFSFNITQFNVDTLSNTYNYSTLKALDTNHVGLVYRGILTEYVPCGTIASGAGVLHPTYVNTGANTVYTVVSNNYTSISVGSRVRLLNHNSTPNLNDLVGEIVSVNSIASTIGIKYENINMSAYGADANNGQITVENKFVLVKGRII